MAAELMNTFFLNVSYCLHKLRCVHIFYYNLTELIMINNVYFQAINV